MKSLFYENKMALVSPLTQADFTAREIEKRRADNSTPSMEINTTQTTTRTNKQRKRKG